MLELPVQSSTEDEEKEQEYTIKLEYRVIVEEDNTRTVKVVATSEDAAIEKAWEENAAFEGSTDIEEDSAEVVKVVDLSIRGAADDKTMNLFPNFKNLPRGTKGAPHARQ